MRERRTDDPLVDPLRAPHARSLASHLVGDGRERRVRGGERGERHRGFAHAVTAQPRDPFPLRLQHLALAQAGDERHVIVAGDGGAFRIEDGQQPCAAVALELEQGPQARPVGLEAHDVRPRDRPRAR